MLIQMIVIQVLTFLAIVFVMRKFLYSASAKESSRLKQLKEETLAQRKELSEKIEEAQAAFQQKMAEAEKTVQAMSAKAESDAKAERQKILDKAKDEAEGVLSVALNAKEKIREEIAVDMIRKTPALASKIFLAVLSPDVKALVHKELVLGAIEKIKGLDRSIFKERIDRGEILSAFPLPPHEKSEIESALRMSLGHAIACSDKQDAGLAAGIVIKLGTMVIDATLENKIRQVEKDLAHDVRV